MSYKNTLGGGCHCGNVTFELYTNRDALDFAPRACQCTFCRRHDVNWIADPEGKAQVRYADAKDVNTYRFGTRTADFIICKKCGVITAALCNIDGVTKAVFNTKAMLDCTFPAPPLKIVFDDESPEERMARRKKNWTGEVSIIG